MTIKPRSAAIIGGIIGLIAGALFLSDINGAPLFTMLVVGFVSYEITWALNTIGNSKSLTKKLKDRDKRKGKEDP